MKAIVRTQFFWKAFSTLNPAPFRSHFDAQRLSVYWVTPPFSLSFLFDILQKYKASLYSNLNQKPNRLKFDSECYLNLSDSKMSVCCTLYSVLHQLCNYSQRLKHSEIPEDPNYFFCCWNKRGKKSLGLYISMNPLIEAIIFTHASAWTETNACMHKRNKKK